MLALPVLVFTANGTAAAQTRPDGSAVTENFTTAGGSSAWFAAFLTEPDA